MADLPPGWNAGDEQFPGSNFNLSQLLAGAAGGAAAGTAVSPGIGTAIGGLVGLGGGLINEFTGPNSKDIYDNLMKQYYSTPEYAATQDALGKIKEETVQGPTATEKQNLDLALRAANQQAAAAHGAIQQRLAGTQGMGAGTEAALIASQGQGQATQMSSAAMQAAAA
jgi:hypothetical protein